MRHKNLVAWYEVDQQDSGNGEKFQLKRRRLGAAAGGKQIGCSHIELPAGKSGWPAHQHLANEEAVYVLEGEGTLRLGEETFPLRAGDYVTLLAGGPAHRIDNTSAAPLKYLAFSTMIEPEVVLYPDSGKIGVLARSTMALAEVHKRDGAVDYWEGEK